MPKCPKCNDEIDTLNNYQSGENKYKLFIQGKDYHYDEDEFQPNNQVNDYECPHCGEVLFRDEDKAIEFLRGN